MKNRNTKDNPLNIQTLEDYYKNPSLWVSFICIKCGKKEVKRDVSIEKMDELICGPCLRKKSNLINHGSETWNNKEKAKQTCISKYGVDNIFKSSDFIEGNKVKIKSSSQEAEIKRRKTKLERYGSENYNNSEKRIKTNQKRYGGNSPASSKEVIKKQINTMREKYGDNLPGPMAMHQKALNYRLNQLGDILDFVNKEDFRGKYDENGSVYYLFKCNKCNNEFRDNFHSGLPTCRKCNPITFTKQETEVIDYIKSIYTGIILEHDRKILSGKELDIYLPELGIAFEYNGTYWHSFNSYVKTPFNEFKRKTEEKRLLCEKQDIRLINIDECDWLDRPEVIKRFISDTILPRVRIGARDCIIKEIDTKTAKDFCEYYHVNGFRGGCFKYGLYYNSELLIVAIFSPYKNEYECVRLCYKSGYDVIGGWAKIRKSFGRKFLHYVNLKYFRGENKTGCGFRFVFGNPRKILHRNALQRKTGLLNYCKTYDSNISDFQNCINNGMFCVVDQGNDIRWYN